MNAVPVPASVFADVNDSAILQIANKFLHRPLGNAHALRDVPQPRFRVMRQVQQHVAVITE